MMDNGRKQPAMGELAICHYCGTPYRFDKVDKELTLRPLREEEEFMLYMSSPQLGVKIRQMLTNRLMSEMKKLRT